MSRDSQLHDQARVAVKSLMLHYHYGAYRVIRDPEGAISLWAIEGGPNDPFSISFVDKGRVYYKIEDVPVYVLNSFIEYVQKSVR
jgi:hypothetical protein